MHKKLKSELIHAPLSQAVHQTFEEMAFIDILEEKEIPQNMVFDTHLKIDILEPVKARIFFCFSESFRNRVAENIFGQETSSLTESDLDDSLLELLNILAGKFLTLYYGKETLHKVDFPEMIVDLSERDKAGIMDLYFNSDGGIFEIKLIEGI